MRRPWAATLVLALAGGMAVAQQTPLHGLGTAPEAAPFTAVGRLEIAGTGFCTGTLIAPDLVLTAAHCLFDRDTGTALDPVRLVFRAGLRHDADQGSRRARRALPHPLYVFDPSAGAARSALDVALVQLADPLPGIVPLPVADEVGPGATVGVVSYAVGREDVPSLQDSCGVLGRERGVLVTTCDVDFGASGAPILRMDGDSARIVSVVSAKGELAGLHVALGTALTQPLAELRALLDAARLVPQARVVAAGDRADTGARFVAAAGVLNGGQALPR